MTCTCCGECAAHPLCDGLCVECARPTHCAHCESEGLLPDEWQWTPENQIKCLCEECIRCAQKSEKIDALCRRVEALAAEHGWDAADGWSHAQTGSRYITLTRMCSDCSILATDDNCDCESLTVRVSDHGSAYCREDVSLVIPSGSASGDDHNLSILRKRLIRLELSDRLRDDTEDAMPDLPPSVYSQLLTAALSDVDYDEIAGTLLEDVQESAQIE